MKEKTQTLRPTQPSGGPVRVLIADDEPSLRDAIGELVRTEPGLELVGTAHDAIGAIESAASLLPDVAVVDVRMPGGGGPNAVRGIREVSPDTRILALSAYEDRTTVVEMLTLGAAGYLVKGVSPDEILDAIQRVAQGQVCLTADMATSVIEELARDTEERRKAGEVVRRSEEKFRKLLESAPDGVVIVDAEGTIVLVNKQTEEMFGYTREDLLGQKIEQLLPERFRAEHIAERDGYIADPVTRPIGAGLELAAKRRDGAEFPVDISLSTIETPEGRLVTAFVRDISERLAAADLQRHLAERRQLLGRLVHTVEEERRRIAADIHDDTVQVMTAVGLRLGLLRKRLDKPDDLAVLDELEVSVRDSIARLRHLLFDLRPPELDREGLVAAIRLSLDQMKREYGLDFELESHLDHELEASTRTIAYRIVQEALSNTRKHADATRVKLVFETRGEGIFGSVRDDGSGFRIEALDDRPENGHLGFVAMRERAEVAGGWFRVQSEPEAGTQIEFWLPDTPLPMSKDEEAA